MHKGQVPSLHGDDRVAGSLEAINCFDYCAQRLWLIEVNAYDQRPKVGAEQTGYHLILGPFNIHFEKIDSRMAEATHDGRNTEALSFKVVSCAA